MGWITSLSLKAKILLSVLGLFVFAALIPAEEEVAPTSSLPEPGFETGDSLGEEVPAPVVIVPPATEPQPEPAPKPQPEPAPALTPKPPEPRPDPKPVPSCEPSYTNVCIPVGSADYDCAGGSGNGPNYIQGPVYVRWDVPNPDPHGLDRDKDGVGCEN